MEMRGDCKCGMGGSCPLVMVYKICLDLVREDARTDMISLANESNSLDSGSPYVPQVS